MAMTVTESMRFTERAEAAASLQTRVVKTITKSTGVTTSGLILLAVSIVAWGLGRFIAGRPLYLLSYGGLTVLGISWGIGRRPLPISGVRASVRSRRREGETVSMEGALTPQRRGENPLPPGDTPPPPRPNA